MIEPTTWEHFKEVVNRAGFAWQNLLGQDKMYPWTPVDSSGAALAFTSVDAWYYRVGRMCHAFAGFTYPATADASGTLIGGFPFLTVNLLGARSGQLVYSNSAVAAMFIMTNNTRTGAFITAAGAVATNAQMTLSVNWIYVPYLVA